MSVSSPAHNSLVARLRLIDEAVDHELLVGRELTNLEHNQRAQMLRSGLMIAAFTSVEDFIRVRTGELLACVSRTVVRFELLPDELKRAATTEAMRAAYEQAKLIKKRGEDPLPMIQQAATEIASTGGGPLLISKYGLGYAGSNLATDDVSGILGCLQVADVWHEIDSIAGRCGATSLSLKEAYVNGHKLRNAAAHDPAANIQPSDLQAFCSQAFSISLGFDILGSRAARLLRLGDSLVLNGRVKLASTIGIRFLRERPRGYAETREGARKAARITVDLDDAWKLALATAAPGGEPIVLCDKAGRPIDWMITDVP
jgi:hypothetical protein